MTKVEINASKNQQSLAILLICFCFPNTFVIEKAEKSKEKKKNVCVGLAYLNALGGFFWVIDLYSRLFSRAALFLLNLKLFLIFFFWSALFMEPPIEAFCFSAQQIPKSDGFDGSRVNLGFGGTTKRVRAKHDTLGRTDIEIDNPRREAMPKLVVWFWH